jgi:hypothetical protein
MGIDKVQAHRWQRIASVPASEFEHYIEEKKQAGEEITTAGVLNLSRERAQSEHVGTETGRPGHRSTHSRRLRRLPQRQNRAASLRSAHRL